MGGRNTDSFILKSSTIDSIVDTWALRWSTVDQVRPAFGNPSPAGEVGPNWGRLDKHVPQCPKLSDFWGENDIDKDACATGEMNSFFRILGVAVNNRCDAESLFGQFWKAKTLVQCIMMFGSGRGHPIVVRAFSSATSKEAHPIHIRTASVPEPGNSSSIVTARPKTPCSRAHIKKSSRTRRLGDTP